MNCAGSEIAENNKGFDCRNMGEVLGKECVKDEPSFAHSSQDSLREVVEGAASSGAASESESDKEVSLDSDEDISWLLSFNVDELSTNKCKCEGCLRRNETYTSEKKNAKLLLSSWKEFQSYIRNVYTNSPFESTQKAEVIQVEENERLHEMIQVMRLCDPYLLFQKIEDEVQAMVLQSRDRQLKLLKNESNASIAEEFITGLIKEYVKLLSSAQQVSSAIEVLLGRQLQWFGLTWDLLNKHLYQSLVYSHYEVQENLPRFISQLTLLPLKDGIYHELVYEYLAIDDEMASIAADWESIEPGIQEYKNSREKEIETLNILQDALKTFFANKVSSVNGNGSLDETTSPLSDISQNCPNCLTRRGCPCDECTVTHMMSCEGLDSPPVPVCPVMRSRSPDHGNEMVCKDELLREEEQPCECYACAALPPELIGCSVTFNEVPGKNSHGETFKLYPNIFETIVENFCKPRNASSGCNNLPATPDVVYPHVYNLDDLPSTFSVEFANVPEVTPPDGVPNINPVIKSVTFEKVQPRSPAKPPQNKNQSPTTISAQITSDPPSLPPPTSQESSSPARAEVQPKSNEKPEKSDIQKVAQPKPVSEVNKSAGSASSATVKKPANKVVPPKETDGKSAVEKPKILPNIKGGGGPCVKSRACGKCCVNCMKTPGCGKGTDKHLAAIARLGLATSTNQRGNLRCPPGKEGEHTHKPGKGHSCGKLKSHDMTKKAANGRVNGHEPDDSSSQDDTCSERSNSTSASTQRDSRHCDCCYCEVFGHGVPSVAPVSRNYQEMRERLRLRLSMKKSAKCKAGQQGQQPGEKSSTANPQDDAKKNALKETDLESLLKFIEGKSREESKDRRRLAKKARQKQKKLEENERIEEEEADRKRLEAMKRQVSISMVNENNHKKSQQQAKQSQPQPANKQQHQQQQSNSKNTNANNNKNNNNNNNNNNNRNNNSNNNNSNNQSRNNQTLNLSGLKSLVEKSDPNSGPKMVTIRRVMAPFSAEPTVTITLKGSTPDKDKVLFMLKNGSETYQPEEKENTKKSKRKRKKGKKEQENYEEMEEEEEPEAYYEEEPEPILEKTGRKKKRKNKNTGAEVETNQKSSRSTNQMGSSKLKATENVMGKNNKNKNSKNNSGGKTQDHASNKNKSSNVSVSVKSNSQNRSSLQVSSSKANSLKNVPVLKAQNQNVKNKESANSKTSKNVSNTKISSNSNNNNCVNSKISSNSVKGGVRNSNVSNSVNSKNSKNQKQSVAVSGSNQKSAAVQTGKNQEKQSKNKKAEETAQRQNQNKVKGNEAGKSKTVQKSGKNTVEKVQHKQEVKSIAQKQHQQQESGKKKRTVMESSDLVSRFSMNGGYDRGKVVINTPSYRLSEVLSSIAPSPPPKEEINLENLRLPPGITITKIEGPITKSIRASEQPLHVSKPTPVTPPIVVSTPPLKQNHPPPPGNVIVVDTGRLKEVIQENSPNPVQTSTTSKRKKKKNKQNVENAVPSMEVPIPPAYGLKLPKGNPLMGKSGVTVISADEARKMVPSLENQQATIIKTSDNMVTIRSPAFQQAMNMHAYQNSQSFRPGINGYNNVSLFRDDVNRITDSIGKMKLNSEDKLARQMRNLNIKEGSRASQIFAQAMAVAGQNGQETGKKKKKKRKQGNRSDEKEVEPVESVFQPKDIDLENGDIDDDERELEAFKRFCFQSVPSERKNKVKVNLNIKDIVLKKKSSAIGCS